MKLDGQSSKSGKKDTQVHSRLLTYAMQQGRVGANGESGEGDAGCKMLYSAASSAAVFTCCLFGWRLPFLGDETRITAVRLAQGARPQDDRSSAI